MIKEPDLPTWKREPYSDRVRRCIAVLYLNGIITHAERGNAHKRLEKQMVKITNNKGRK